MKSYLRFTLIFLFTLGIFLFQLPSAFAGWDHNIRGEAYTQQEDYIYFNCLDEPKGVFTYTFPFPLGGDPCDRYHQGLNGDINNYGVHLDYSTYTFEGYALHDQFGLISFRNGIPDEVEYDYSFVDNCPNTSSTDCSSNNNCSACYNIESERVHGWAYVIADNDWIKLDSDEIQAVDKMGILNYQASDAGDFFGFFHYDNWGEVDLNCELPINDCSPNYKVYIGMVSLAEMSAPHWESKACSTTAKGAVLRWKVHGGKFNKYDIRINNQDDFGNAYQFSLAEGDAGYNPFQSTVGEYGFDYDLDWNTSYTWWLRLHDDHVYSTTTDWIQFNHSETSDVQGVLSENPTKNTLNSFDSDKTFTTYKHEWPRPYFTWEGYPSVDFQAGSPNRFEVTEDTHYYTGPNAIDKVVFGSSSFMEDFNWWGEVGGVESSDITIVDAAIFPDSVDPFFRLDASSIDGLEHNQLIKDWDDISNNSNHLVQNDTTKRPRYHLNALNGRPAIYFDGSKMKNTDLTLNQPFNIFVVAKSDTNLKDAYILDSDIVDGSSLGYDNDSRYLMWAGIALSGGSINDNLSLWTAYYNDETSSLRIEQENQVFNPIASGDEEFINKKEGIVVGSDKYGNKDWKGYIAEIIIYDMALNANQRQEIEEYLTLKWGIDEKDEATASKVDVYFESIQDEQKVWLSLTDEDGYTCSTTTPDLNVNFELPLWREIRARENQ